MFKIFPATLTPDGQKVPLIKGWQAQATQDPAQIKQWTEFFGPKITFWGIPTGLTNGILALDIDVKPGKDNGFETLTKHAITLPDTLTQTTMSGGRHLIFKYPNDGKHYGNKAGFLPGLDIRGEGGWIAFYGTGMDYSKPILNAPDWVLNTNKPASVTTGQSNVAVSPDIAISIFNASLDAIRNAPAGESNDTLNTEAFRIGQLVASGSLSRQYAEDELFKAAKDRGKPDREARATINSGLNGGASNPITCPFSDPVPAFKLPDVPLPPEITRWTPKYFTRGDLFNFSKLRKPQLFKDWCSEDIRIISADGGTGKTTLLLYEAICLALGDRFLGFDAKQTGKTLFITGEDTAEKLGAMLGAIIRQMGLHEDHEKLNAILTSIVVKKDADLCLINKDKMGFLTVNRYALDQVLQAVDDLKPKLIVFDPIASFWGSESALNDMNKAVAKFMSELVEKSQACVTMVNHIGKQSSSAKDMTQFAGRGGTGLPSHSRISKVLRPLSSDEYREMTGNILDDSKSAMLCNVNKFSDGSPLLNKPFVIVREGYLFTRETLSPVKEKQIQDQTNDVERVYALIKETLDSGQTITRSQAVAYFKSHNEAISDSRVKAAIEMLTFKGYMGIRLDEIENPDLTKKSKVLVIKDAV